MKWKDFVGLCSKTDIWESNREEHNRYLKPPKGISIFHWVHMLLKLKYEYSKHRPWKDERG